MPGRGGAADPAAGGQCCRECRAPVAVLVGPTGWVQVCDSRWFNPRRGWVCPVHVCAVALELRRLSPLGE